MDKIKIHLWRLLLFFVCFIVTIVCLISMSKSSDPLARYPYATNENREKILTYLDQEDIDYIITQQMKPEIFLPFIEVEGFTVRNAYFYYEANQVRKESAEYIVNFINRFRGYFSLNSLSAYLSHYSYVDLTTFFENEQSFSKELTLVEDPNNLYTLLDLDHTVYKYEPDSLVSFGSIVVKEEMIDELTQMSLAYQTMTGKEFQFSSGYLPYETLYNQYNDAIIQYSQQAQNWIFPPGQEEKQLGYTVILQEQDAWLEAYRINDGDLVQIKEGMDENTIIEWEWLEENSYRFGFVIRYPKGKEDQTHRWYQPFVLRYVGKELAKELHDTNQCLEEVDWKSWNEREDRS